MSVDGQLGVGEQALKQHERGSRIGLGQRVDLHLGRGLGCPAAPAQALHGPADDLVLFGRAPGDEFPALGVDRQLGARHQRLERGRERARGNRRPGPEDRIGLEPRLVFRRFGLDLVDRRMNRLLVGRNRQRDEAPRLRIDGELGIRQQALQQGKHGIRIGLG